ncbi:TSC2 [Candida pseudojiufengensis]|uniref:TSC2 n=1 Tax=Candida pseudojiufengensis TaxID=497109 RepID=UPI00222403F5|nr:TSC2 [Candida pseudojiufengensis]KAI5965908.1 TSC2 [Candida pseudojiufengensis]
MSTHHPTFSSSSGLGSVFRSLTKTFKPSSSSKNVPVTINPTVVGGGIDLQDLINQILSQNISQQQQLKALEKLTESVSKYSISSIQEIWYLARQFLDVNKGNKQIRNQTLRLLNVCIEKDDNSVGSRTRYFQDIYKCCQFYTTGFDLQFDLYLQALIKLSDNGRDIHDLIITEDNKNLIKFFNKGLEVLIHISENNNLNEENLQNSNNFIEFMSNCLKFNYGIINDNAVGSMIEKIIKINIDNELLIISIIELLKSASKYGNIPTNELNKLIRHTSIIYGKNEQNEIITKNTFEIIDQLSNEISYDYVCKVLCQDISNVDKLQLSDFDNHSKNLDYYSCIGSINLIMLLQIKNVLLNKNKNEFPFFLIINSVNKILKLNIPLLNGHILNLFNEIFQETYYSRNFNLQVTGSFDLIFPFQIWYYNENSLFDLFDNFKINNETDSNNLKNLTDSIRELYENHELSIPKDKLIEFYLNFSSNLSNNTSIFILNQFDEDKSCSLLNPLWKESSLKILNKFYYNKNISTIVKLKCLEVIFSAYKTSILIFDQKDINYDILIDILKKSINLSNDEILLYLAKEIIVNLLVDCPTSVFNKLIEIMKPLYSERKSTSKNEIIIARGYVTTTTTPDYSNSSPTNETFLKYLTKSICKAFIISHPERSVKCYNFLIEISQQTSNGEILLIIIKSLIRIRVTSENFIYFVQPSDMNGLASAFKRDNATLTAGQLWNYPEFLDYVPESFFNKPNKFLQLQTDKNDEIDVFYIDIKQYFNLILNIFENFIDWELYSFCWAHFCSQLSNMKLFQNYNEEILRLKTIICNQLKLKLPKTLKIPTNEDLTKADLQVAFVRSFSALIGYHDLFSKSDEDEIIDGLIFGLSSWEKTSIPCINILTISCFEIPMSIKKYLSLILIKLQTKITSVNASTHTLEFLSSLIHLPILTSNFTIDEFKRVFGIAFKYIQYSKDLEKMNLKNITTTTSNEVILKHGVDAEIEKTPSTQQNGVSPILIQYILMLSYNVISSWFLKIEMNDRKKISSFLIKNLIACDNEDNNSNDNNFHHLTDQTMGFLDFITKFTYSDFPLKIIYSTNKKFLQNDNDDPERTILNRWMVGCSVVSIETDIYSGDTDILIRKPTGVSKLIMKLNHETDLNKSKPEKAINPNYFLLQLFDSISKPIPIIEDSILLRALNVLDRIPSVEFHKIGIIYINKNQTTENEVLLNKIGSIDYQKFLNQIGKLIKLKGEKEIYCGGLDIENNLDGEFTRYWRNKLTQIIFHITTMMNNEEENGDSNDTTTSNSITPSQQRIIDLKKRHIGNNHVNIFWDESNNQDFNFNLIKSQFNFLNIVITPQTINLDNSMSSNSERKFFKIKTFRRSGVPAVFSTSHFKIISSNQLPFVIRNLSILASEFANVWYASVSNNNNNTTTDSNISKFESNWAKRVKQLHLIYDKSLENFKNLNQSDNNNIDDVNFINNDKNGSSFTNNIEKFENFEQSSLKNIYSSVEFNSYTL